MKDDNVARILMKYDALERGYLTRENFMDFYHGAAKTRASVVWENLTAHKYGPNLRPLKPVDSEL